MRWRLYILGYSRSNGRPVDSRTAVAAPIVTTLTQVNDELYKKGKANPDSPAFDLTEIVRGGGGRTVASAWIWC